MARRAGGGDHIIPSTTGAAKAVGEVLPRPRAAHRHVLPGADAERFRRRSRLPLGQGDVDRGDRRPDEEGQRKLPERILGYCDEELVSTDFIHDARSSIYDSLATLQNNLKGEKRFFKVVAWYDNEWGYANRVVDLLRFMAEKDGATRRRDLGYGSRGDP